MPKPTMLIQLPMAATKSAPAAATTFIKYCARAEAAEDLRANRLPAGREVGAQEPDSRPGARSTTPGHVSSTSATSSSAAGSRRTRSGSTSRRPHDQDRTSGRRPHPLAPSRRGPRPARRITADGTGQHGPLARRHLDVSAPDRRPADRGTDLGVAQGRGARVLAGHLEPRGRRSARAHVRGGLRRRPDQRRPGHDHGLGPRPRRLPRQVDRQLGHRPAVRAADDRRRPDAAHALRPELAGRDRRRVHANRDPARPLLRHAPVRDPDGAAGADRARRGDGGGGALARGESVHRLPADRLAEHPPGDPLRLRSRVCPGARRDRRDRPRRRQLTSHGGRLGLHLQR